VEKGAIGDAVTFNEQTLHAEFQVEDLQDVGEVQLIVAGEDVGDTFGTQRRELGVEHFGRENQPIGSRPLSLRDHAIFPCASNKTP
jgi:hypothetical protein